MTRSRTDTSVETATSVSATAVTTSITLALPDAIATVCASDFFPGVQDASDRVLEQRAEGRTAAAFGSLAGAAGVQDAGEIGVGICSDCG